MKGDFTYESGRPGMAEVWTYGLYPGEANYYYPPFQFVGYGVTSSGKRDTQISVTTPGWPAVRRKPDNPFKRLIAKRSDPIGDMYEYWVHDPTSGTTYAGHLAQTVHYICNAWHLGAVEYAGPPADDPYPGAVSKLQSRLSLAKTNTAVAMAEAKKTAALVTKTASRLYRAYSSLRKFQFGRFVDELGLSKVEVKVIERKFGRFNAKRKEKRRTSTVSSFAAETWLEYSYGWKPLLMDIYNHAEALAETCVEHQWVVREVKAKHETIRKSYQAEIRSVSGHLKHELTTVDTRKAAIEVRYSIPPGTVSAVRAFGLTNPLEVVWELVPFSFIVDWFIPIGDAIRGLTSTVGLTFHSGWVTTYAIQDMTSSVVPSGKKFVQGSQWLSASGKLTMKHEAFAIQRTLLSDFPRTYFPDFSDNWRGNGRGDLLKDMSHGLSAISLLKTIFLDSHRGGSATLRT